MDGEGSISHRHRRRNEHRQLIVSISNTEAELLNFVLTAVGAGKITGKRTYKNHHTPSLTYTISNRQALALLQQFEPHLRAYKAHRARRELRDYLRLTPRNGKYTEEFLAERQDFVSQFQALNSRGTRA